MGKIGRPKLKVDLQRACDLASVGCPDFEIAAAMGVARRTFERAKAEEPGFAEAMQAARARKHASLRRKLWGIAEDDDHPKQMTAIIFLAKAALGMNERNSVVVEEPIRVEHEPVDDPARIAGIIAVLREAGVLEAVLNGDRESGTATAVTESIASDVSSL